ncbi:hypothetical protein RB653_007360 [Dictyostelium firmibasis]|uniref:FNIP repeat-containing protein n=1 Tax=Dictyostelium firmibasis TaxID=79012 RepID=A0AAN7TNH9_9MYCE
MDKLFGLVFKNKYLFKLIFRYSRLYLKNERVKFYSRETLSNYSEREYIGKLVYYGGELLEIGDLPNNGVLKEVSFFSKEAPRDGKIIPYGVEVIQLNGVFVPLDTFPSTINKITYLVIPIEKEIFEIPPNITSLSIYKCSLNNILKYLPNTIKELEFDLFYEDDLVDVQPKIILPNNLIKLSLGKYNIKYLDEGILPITIKQLEISTCKTNNQFDLDNNEFFENNSNYSIGLFNILKPLKNLEVLSITTNSWISKESNLKDCNSIKDLTIHCNNSYRIDFLEDSIEEHSLPQSVTKLKLLNFTNNQIKSNVIPIGVLSLTIDRIEIDQMPQSLTHLKLYEKPNYFYTEQESLSLLSKLPKSLTKLTVPSYLNDFNLIYPDNIKNIKFR